MKHPKVSIIIPVYNSEKFLINCLDSVVNQTFNDVEIIVINDGSTDGSLKILEYYAGEYSKIILLDQDNVGYSSTVNRGLNIANGDYIAFVDGDDYIELDMIEILYKEAAANDLDLAVCNWDRVDAYGNFLSYNDHSQFDNKFLTKKEVIREFFLNGKEMIEGYTWNKLIKRSLLNDFNIRFPKINYSDIPTMFKVLTKVNKCKYINKPLYHYVQNHTSISHTINANNAKGFINAVQMINSILLEENLMLDFEDAYFVYKSNAFFSEYSVYREQMKSSKEVQSLFKGILQPITIKKCISLNKIVNIKLLIKVCLYKTGLLRIFLFTYHKYKKKLKQSHYG
ncbi:glycosyltransferase [Bacillus sp. S/N-304-OC-R1]|uniref:glycosyltransferase n=1 Tax=Bacillus sp. S/N-304-OC-R1 TaxID=2758034 RepID=UPI001C8CF47C|nr:glycosyltransferase [Bacillus sp. S/N-304-OC-R1]MBY0124241.1 glycosyltransferase [Bacillus sp. S/N-304-OC-R1]